VSVHPQWTNKNFIITVKKDISVPIHKSIIVCKDLNINKGIYFLMKRGIREEILDLNNKGMVAPSKLRSVAAGAGAAAGGLLSNMRSREPSSSSSSDSDSKGPKLTSVAMVIGLILILIVGGVTINAYGKTEQGKTNLLKVTEVVGEYNPITWYFDLLEEQKVLDVWDADTNASSTKKGIELWGMDPGSGVSGGSVSVPKGQMFEAFYDFEFHEVEDFSFNVDFFCQLEDISGDVEGYGTIVPYAHFDNLAQGQTVSCRIDGETTAELDPLAYNIVGWLEFPFETMDVTLPVYFASEEVYNVLQDADEGFFDYYRIEESGKIRAVHNGEPLKVGIGISYSGREEQPVYVREGSSPAIGISIENYWDGEVVDITDMYFYLPNGIKVNSELSGNPASHSCPFEYIGVSDNKNMYRLDQQTKEEMFESYYEADLPVLGDTSLYGNERNFLCWLDIEEGFAGATYKFDDDTRYIVDVKYIYRTNQRATQVNIVDTTQEMMG